MSGKTKADFGHGQARFVTYMNVFSNPISNPEMTEPIEIDPKQNEVEVGDVFFTTSSETPEEVGMSSVLLEKRGKIYLNSFCFGFRPTEKIDSYYLAYMLRSESAREKIILLAQGISRYNISKNKVMEIAVSLPSLDEQKLIGQYFRQLDNLITLHQREFAFLCKEKSKKFRYIKNAWEQRKLSECAGFRRGSFPQPYGNKEWYDGEGAMPFVQVADVADDMKLVDDTKQKISKLAQPMSVYADKGSVLVTLQGSIGRVAITQYGAFVDRTVLIFDKYNQDIDKTFWAYIIKEKFIDEARKAPGGTIKTITKEALSDFDLMLPNYDEQKKLGAFLVSIDNLITLHQRKPNFYTGGYYAE